MQVLDSPAGFANACKLAMYRHIDGLELSANVPIGSNKSADSSKASERMASTQQRTTASQASFLPLPQASKSRSGR
jgi:hypothetical protein